MRSATGMHVVCIAAAMVVVLPVPERAKRLSSRRFARWTGPRRVPLSQGTSRSLRVGDPLRPLSIPRGNVAKSADGKGCLPFSYERAGTEGYGQPSVPGTPHHEPPRTARTGKLKPSLMLLYWLPSKKLTYHAKARPSM